MPNTRRLLRKAEIKELFATQFKQKDKYKVASLGNAILTSPTGKNQSYYELLDKMLSMEPKEVLEEIKPNISRTMKVFNKIQELKQYLDERNKN